MDEICIKKSRSNIYFPPIVSERWEDKSLNSPLSSGEDFRPFDDKVKTFDEFGICMSLYPALKDGRTHIYYGKERLEISFEGARKEKLTTHGHAQRGARNFSVFGPTNL